MIGDTIGITVNAVAKTLVKINQDGYASEYFLKEATQEFRMKIRNSYDKPAADGSKVQRHNVELTQVVYATSTTAEITRRSYVVITHGNADDAVSIGYLQSALNGFMTAANVTKLTNFES